MAEQKHTAEPWVMRQFSHAMRPRDMWIVDSIPDKDGEFVGNVVVPPTSNPNDTDDKIRIVACVNALAGISDPSAVGELVVEFEAMFEALQKVIPNARLTEPGKRAISLLSRLKGTP